MDIVKRISLVLPFVCFCLFSQQAVALAPQSAARSDSKIGQVYREIFNVIKESSEIGIVGFAGDPYEDKRFSMTLSEPLPRFLEETLFKQPDIISFGKDASGSERRDQLIINAQKYLERKKDVLEGAVGREWEFKKGDVIVLPVPSLRDENRKRRLDLDKYHIVEIYKDRVPGVFNLFEPIAIQPGQVFNIFNALEEFARRNRIPTGLVWAKGGELYEARFAIYSEKDGGYRDVLITIDRKNKTIRLDYEDFVYQKYGPHYTRHKDWRYGWFKKFQGEIETDVKLTGWFSKLTSDEYEDEPYVKENPDASRLWYYVRSKDPQKPRGYDPIFVEDADETPKKHKRYLDSFAHLHTAFTLSFTNMEGEKEKLYFMGHLWSMEIKDPEEIHIYELTSKDKGTTPMKFVRIDNYENAAEKLKRITGLDPSQMQIYLGSDIISKDGRVLEQNSQPPPFIKRSESIALGEYWIIAGNRVFAVGAVTGMEGFPGYAELLLFDQPLLPAKEVSPYPEHRERDVETGV